MTEANLLLFIGYIQICFYVFLFHNEREQKKERMGALPVNEKYFVFAWYNKEGGMVKSGVLLIFTSHHNFWPLEFSNSI